MCIAFENIDFLTGKLIILMKPLHFSLYFNMNGNGMARNKVNADFKLKLKVNCVFDAGPGRGWT